jgi:hypothetical protein
MSIFRSHHREAHLRGKIATPPTMTKIVAKEADFTLSVLPIRHLRDEVLEDFWTHNETLSIVAMRVCNPDRTRARVC